MHRAPIPIGLVLTLFGGFLIWLGWDWVVIIQGLAIPAPAFGGLSFLLGALALTVFPWTRPDAEGSPPNRCRWACLRVTWRRTGPLVRVSVRSVRTHTPTHLGRRLT